MTQHTFYEGQGGSLVLPYACEGVCISASTPRCHPHTMHRPALSLNLDVASNICQALLPGLSPTHWSTTIGPLAVVLSINAMKELYDDYFRQKSDKVVNASMVEAGAYTRPLLS